MLHVIFMYNVLQGPKFNRFRYNLNFMSKMKCAGHKILSFFPYGSINYLIGIDFLVEGDIVYVNYVNFW